MEKARKREGIKRKKREKEKDTVEFPTCKNQQAVDFTFTALHQPRIITAKYQRYKLSRCLANLSKITIYTFSAWLPLHFTTPPHPDIQRARERL